MAYDVIVVGGGPAGSTVAGILLRHRPASRVLVLERARFPRFHVGETLVTELNRTLGELGVYDRLAEGGFIRKLGATFVWGDTEQPWHMLFGELDRVVTADTGLGTVQTTWSWHVERARYDQILLDHAASLGAEVQQETGVAALLRDETGRVVGVRTDAGEEHRARFVIDATGQQGLEGSLSDRELDPVLRNVAYGTYWTGARLLSDYNGTLEASRAFIVSHPHGWSWVFPVRPDLVSVGVVTSLDRHKARRGADPEAFVRQAIADSPYLADILRDATLTEGPQDTRVRVTSDFSYTSRSIVQPGLVRVGDAAGFVDPILSVGCFLGQSFARFLGYALRTALDGDPKVGEDRALAAYEHQVRDTLAAFRELTYFFYRFNQAPDDWWAHARSLVASTAFPRAMSDREAFLAFATGFAAHGSVWREPGAFFDEVFFLDLYTRFVQPDASTDAAHAPVSPADVLQLAGDAVRTPSAVPLDGEGRLAPSLRVEIAGDPSEGARRLRKLHVPPALGAVFDHLDGSTSLADIADAVAAAQGVPDRHRKALDRYVLWVGQGLVDRGLATVSRQAAAGAA